MGDVVVVLQEPWVVTEVRTNSDGSPHWVMAAKMVQSGIGVIVLWRQTGLGGPLRWIIDSWGDTCGNASADVLRGDPLPDDSYQVPSAPPFKTIEEK